MNLFLMRDQRVPYPLWLGLEAMRKFFCPIKSNGLRVRSEAVLNVDLRSTLLTLGNTRASSVLLSLNRNVNLLIVNLLLFRLCKEPCSCHLIQPVAEFTEPRAVPLSLAEPMEQRAQSQTCLSFAESRQRKTIGQSSNGCLQTFVPGAGLLHFVTVNGFSIQSSYNAAAGLAVTIRIDGFAHLFVCCRIIKKGAYFIDN